MLVSARALQDNGWMRCGWEMVFRQPRNGIKEGLMHRVEREARELEVGRTGLIPVGTEVHHRRLRNPTIGYLLGVIRQTEALIASGACHAEWGRKRMEALRKMLEAKERKLQKKRVSA
jgi:hypothetical protein